MGKKRIVYIYLIFKDKCIDIMNNRYKYVGVLVVTLLITIILGARKYFDYRSLIKNGKITTGMIIGNSYAASTAFGEYKFKPIRESSFYYNRIQIKKNYQIKYNLVHYLVIYDSTNFSNNLMILKTNQNRNLYFGKDLSEEFIINDLLPSFWEFI